MNLKRLLTVGGSLEARKGATGRYRTAPTGVIPKFQVRGDMISAIPMEGVVPSRQPASAKASPGPLFDAATAPVAPARSVAVPVANGVPSVKPVKAPSTNPFASGGVGPAVRRGWMRAVLDRVADLLSEAFSGRGNRVRAVRPVVQGELGLDSVKPLRNDLSGSDFEVVAGPVAQPALIVRSTGENQETNSAAPVAESAPVDRRANGSLLGAKD